jgi:electron transfer flavoprotein beta subunit
MRIIAPIKQILDPRGLTIRRDKERVFVNREEYIIDPGSKAALEAALRLKEDTAATVIAITVGEPRADDALREALAMGCDSATLLSDPIFTDADISGTIRILVAAIEGLGGADLVVAGRESGDSGAGQIGARLAGALGYSQVTDVWMLVPGEGGIECTRRWGDGFAVVRAPLPAVVTVAPEAFPPRLAHGARIMSAYREWEVPVWSAGDLRLATEDLVPQLSVRSESFPPPLEVGEVFRGDPSEVAKDVIMALKQQRLVR